MADPTDPTKHLNLLYEERLAKLVAPNKRLHGSIAGEKILKGFAGQQITVLQRALAEISEVGIAGAVNLNFGALRQLCYIEHRIMSPPNASLANFLCFFIGFV